MTAIVVKCKANPLVVSQTQQKKKETLTLLYFHCIHIHILQLAGDTFIVFRHVLLFRTTLDCRQSLSPFSLLSTEKERECVCDFFFWKKRYGMYVVPPPQRSDPGSGSGDLRVYQAWKGSNVSSPPSPFLFLTLNFVYFKITIFIHPPFCHSLFSIFFFKFSV